MDPIGARGVVLEHDLDRIADFGAQGRPQQAKVFVLCGASFPCGERSVRILAIERLPIHVADVIGARLRVSGRRSLEGFPGHDIDAERRVVPFGLFGCNVIRADASARRRGEILEILLRLRRRGSRRRLDQPSDAQQAHRPDQAFHGVRPPACAGTTS